MSCEATALEVPLVVPPVYQCKSEVPMWIATFVVDFDAPFATNSETIMLADCYQRCLHPKLCIHEALPFASCVQGCGRTSETRLCCPTCIEPGNSILWYQHLAAIHAFFLHSAEPSVKVVEIVAQKFNKMYFNKPV